MSAVTSRVKGSIGTATNSSFFGPLPDKWNMLSPMHGTTGGGLTGFVQDTYLPGNLINSWTIFNTSFTGGSNHPTLTLGATATAPDGTSNAQKIVESSDGVTAQKHFLSAGFSVFGTPAIPSWAQRFQFFAKPAERTKIEALFNNTTGDAGGIKCVFDLANVSVGPLTSYFVNNSLQDWTASSSATISKYGNTGWLLCTLDVVVDDGGHTANMFSLMLIDGSGNESYIGDGTSGLYVWRATTLPPGAWSMSNQVAFFDDFTDNTMSQFDMAGTRGPNFKWWFNTVPNYPNPNYNGSHQASLPSDFSVSGSKLTIDNTVSGNFIDMAWTAVYNETAPSQNIFRDPGGIYDQRGYHSFLYQPPVLLETSTTFWNPNQGNQQPEQAVWSNNFEELCYTLGFDVGGGIPVNYEPTWTDCREYNDLYPQQGEEFGIGSAGTGDVYQYAFYKQNPGVGNSAGSYGPWRAGRTAWNGFSVIYRSGQLYTLGPASISNNPDPLLGAPWAAFTPDPFIGFTPVNLDYTQQQTYSCLWIPQNRNNQKDCGQFVTFLNGNYCSVSRYGAFTHGTSLGALGRSAVWHGSESQHFTVLIQAPFAPASGPMITDFVRVSK